MHVFWRGWMLCGLLLTSASVAATPFEDSMAQRLLACTACHGEQGRAAADGYYPRLAGKPVGYLYSQLRHFRSGQRHYAPMESLLEPLSDAYLYAIAEHFAAQQVPYPPPGSPAPVAARAARGKQLATEGDATRQIPACARCHGDALMGVQPHVPALLGLPRDYLNAQLGAWRTGRRHSYAPDCMAEVANALSGDDLAAVVDWLAAQPVPANGKPATRLLQPMPKTCGVSTAVVASNEPVVTATTARGLELARQGNCIHCHTANGGALLAGGRRIDTPFGAVYSGNLTPDVQTGLGRWSREDFWQALHHGKSRDGRLLSPAFPYTNFTLLSRADADAIFDWLQVQVPVTQAQPAPDLRWPFGTQWALAVWRTAFFTPASFVPQPGKSEQWNRGAYLARGLGHCDACHGERNLLGAPVQAHGLGGSAMPGGLWYAPSLHDPVQAGLQNWSSAEVLRLLKTGTAKGGQTAGPMAEVVRHSLQFWSESDLQALSTYLQDLAPVTRKSVQVRTDPALGEVGAKVYRRHCAQCHGDKGEGVGWAYPALARNRAVNADTPVNLVHSVLRGGFAPATQGQPRPFGMPPFAPSLSDHEIAAVLTYVRSSWGNTAGAVSPVEVDRLRPQKN